MHGSGPINAAVLANHEKKPHQAALLNEGQAAELFGVSRRTFHTLRLQPWFIEVCMARKLGPRILRFHRDELLAAAKNAPRRVVLDEPPTLVAARDRKHSKVPA